MSTVGLYSTLYTKLSECAELLDRTLIELKQRKPNASEKISDRQRKLGVLLVSFTKKSNELDVQLLIALLQNIPKKRLIEWEKIGQALLSNQITSNEISKLEKLAKSLEYERASTFAKMRGDNA